jgi:hypothetical protein
VNIIPSEHLDNMKSIQFAKVFPIINF